MSLSQAFTTFAKATSTAAGRPITFGIACAVIIVWGLSGPVFGYSDTWQLVINTGTTIVTFLMVFLIQNTQNRDGAALQAKLDELLRSFEGARNSFVGIENLTDTELADIVRSVEGEAADECEDPELAQKLKKLHAAIDEKARAARKPQP